MTKSGLLSFRGVNSLKQERSPESYPLVRTFLVRFWRLREAKIAIKRRESKSNIFLLK